MKRRCSRDLSPELPIHKMNRTGTHIILDGRKCLYDFSNSDLRTIERDIRCLLEDYSMSILHASFHDFHSPKWAFTGIFLLSESHFSIHTFPEEAYIAVDIFVCNLSDDKSLYAQKFIEKIVSYFSVQNANITTIKR